jgi:hypothetical protein
VLHTEIKRKTVGSRQAHDDSREWCPDPPPFWNSPQRRGRVAGWSPGEGGGARGVAVRQSGLFWPHALCPNKLVHSLWNAAFCFLDITAPVLIVPPLVSSANEVVV